MSGMPDKIPGVDPTQPLQDIAKGQDDQKPSQSFDQFMQESGQANGPEAQKPSPLDLAAQGRNVQSTPPTLDSLRAQTESASSVLGDIQTGLNTKNLKLKSPQRYLLNTKLGESNKNIRMAGEAAGAKMTEPPSTLGRKNPVSKFIDMVNDSQINLEQTQNQLKQLSTDGGKNLNPGKLLLIQVKLSKAQQQLDYSSVVLSKAVEGLKTLFNIQL